MEAPEDELPSPAEMQRSFASIHKGGQQTAMRLGAAQGARSSGGASHHLERRHSTCARLRVQHPAVGGCTARRRHIASTRRGVATFRSAAVGEVLFQAMG
jgi:hypothetical protein